MIYTVNTTPIGIYPMPGRNGGIVPPWLAKPQPITTLPVPPGRPLVGASS